MKASSQKRNCERGGAGIKLVIALVVLLVIGHAGYNYIPVAYQCEEYKQKMSETIMQAYAMPNTPLNSPESVKAKLRKFGDEAGVPATAIIKIDKIAEGAMRAHVTFTKQIEILPFGLYKHNYNFNHSAQPTGFLTK